MTTNDWIVEFGATQIIHQPTFEIWTSVKKSTSFYIWFGSRRHVVNHWYFDISLKFLTLFVDFLYCFVTGVIARNHSTRELMPTTVLCFLPFVKFLISLEERSNWVRKTLWCIFWRNDEGQETPSLYWDPYCNGLLEHSANFGGFSSL